jgi:hypothetical protein
MSVALLSVCLLFVFAVVFSARSHEKAARAQAAGKFDLEIVPVTTTVNTDDGAMSSTVVVCLLVAHFFIIPSSVPLSVPLPVSLPVPVHGSMY